MGRQRGGFGARDLRGKRRGARRVCGARGHLCPLQIQALVFQSAALEFQSAALENQSAALKNQIAELWRQGGGRRGAGLAKGGVGRENGGREERSSRNNLFNRYARVRAKDTKWGFGRQNGVYFEKNRENIWQERSNAVSLHPLSR